MKGRPERVFAYSLKLKTAQHNEVEDDAVVLLEYPDATAILLPSWDWPYGKGQAEFYGPQGQLAGDGRRLALPARQGDAARHRESERDAGVHPPAAAREG